MMQYYTYRSLWHHGAELRNGLLILAPCSSQMEPNPDPEKRLTVAT